MTANSILIGFKSSLGMLCKKVLAEVAAMSLYPIMWAWEILPHQDETTLMKVTRTFAGIAIGAMYVSALLYVCLWWPIAEFPILVLVPITVIVFLIIKDNPNLLQLSLNWVYNLWFSTFLIVTYLFSYFD